GGRRGRGTRPATRQPSPGRPRRWDSASSRNACPSPARARERRSPVTILGSFLPHYLVPPPGIYTAHRANWAARERPVSRCRGVCTTDRARSAHPIVQQQPETTPEGARCKRPHQPAAGRPPISIRAAAPTRNRRTAVMSALLIAPPYAQSPASPYSPGLLTGDWIFLSGQGGFDRDTGELV